MNRIWTRVTAFLPGEPEDWSMWCEVFSRHGIDGTVQTDEPPTIAGYVAPDQENTAANLKLALLDFGADKVEIDSVPEEDWAESWKQFFTVLPLGEHFVVVPSWETYDPKPGDLILDLDPGQAFGTGDHPTTKGCLVLLEREGCKGKDVADIGCGSGILSVGAGRLGAKSIVAVDIESPSVVSARENFRRNDVKGKVFEGRGFDPLPEKDTYDLVLSNIISAALIGLAPEAGNRVRPGGAWIVSGIIHQNWPDVEARAIQCGFTLETKWEEGDWIAATFRR